MDVFFCDHHEVPLPPGHRFPMAKYAALRRALVERGVLHVDELHAAPPAPVAALLAVHAPEYVRDVLEGTLGVSAVTRLGFPWSPALVARSLASVGGTLAATRAALHDGLAGNLAGGTHHAHRDFGAGYCVFNDIAVAARAALGGRRDARAMPTDAAAVDAAAASAPHGPSSVKRVLIVDLDVHQGDGTAALFADEPAVFTLSLHGARNFPARKQRSDLDVELPDGTGDDAYLAALAPALAAAFERAAPDLVFYQGGVDPLAADRLGRLALTHAGLRARDTLVLREARRRGLPLVLTLGGGYADPIEASVDAHVNTYREAKALEPHAAR